MVTVVTYRNLFCCASNLYVLFISVFWGFVVVLYVLQLR